MSCAWTCTRRDFLDREIPSVKDSNSISEGVVRSGSWALAGAGAGRVGAGVDVILLLLGLIFFYLRFTEMG